MTDHSDVTRLADDADELRKQLEDQAEEGYDPVVVDELLDVVFELINAVRLNRVEA